MDKLRTLLYISLALVVFMLWQEWQRDYGTPAQTTAAATSPQAKTEQATSKSDADVPVAPAISNDTPALQADVSKGKRIKVETDVYNIEIDTQGGDIRIVDLKNYAVSVEQQDVKYRLMNDTAGDANIFYTQSGLLGDNAPKHNSIYQSAADSYVMAESNDKLAVKLLWYGKNGITVEKVFTFKRGQYDIGVEYRVLNNGNTPWTGRFYRQFKRNNYSEGSRFTYTYTGGVISNSEEPYEKYDFDDMEDKDLAIDMTGGWVAMIQHYFTGAWIAEENQENRVYTKVSAGNQYVLGMLSSPLHVSAGKQNTLKATLYIGPKLQEEMAAVAANLDLVVDYGWLTIIAQPIYWVMTKIHGLVGNWGWSIILLTLLIKVIFYKLSETSYRSMARMRKVTPRMKQLKERYGDDKQGFQQAMMKMYQQEKINPFGGCLPILVQIPVFIALYWVLLESVELRQAPFIFWLKDLSTADPYFVLPIIMGVTMFLQHKLNPTPLDPTQAKIMMMLPLMFTVFFMFFPSGLVLYWTINNILSIAQQWVITKRVVEGKDDKD